MEKGNEKGNVNMKEIHSKDFIAHLANEIEEKNKREEESKMKKTLMEEIDDLSDEDLGKVRDKLFGADNKDTPEDTPSAAAGFWTPQVSNDNPSDSNQADDNKND